MNLPHIFEHKKQANNIINKRVHFKAQNFKLFLLPFSFTFNVISINQTEFNVNVCV